VAQNLIDVGSVRIGQGQPLALIAGPCLAESLELCLDVAAAMRDRCRTLGIGYVFKASFDKANRSSIESDRGPGMAQGLRWLRQVAERLGVPVATDVHESVQVLQVAQTVDLLQIPAFLCRQTDLLTAAAHTGKPINVKKGQFMSPSEMAYVAQKLQHAHQGGAGLMFTERGTFFGYHRLVNDFVGLGDLMDLGYPVCFDVTHSTQQPGGRGSRSGGRPERAKLLARCAVAAGVDCLFLETHPDPTSAQSDADVMLPLDQATDLLGEIICWHRANGT